ncbi:hypothetical protein [Streptomyces sp. NPDC058255]|uniref:hypothetical protein n=1 Tax=Streptomyces sp. NPDC058255 TaxID=3346407 RepID=UPI0036EDE17D
MSAQLPPNQPTSPDSAEVSDLLQRFIELGSHPVEATVDDLVRVRIGAAMNVLTVELLDPTLAPEKRQRLETAIAGAVNTALQRTVLAAGQAVSSFGRGSEPAA